MRLLIRRSGVRFPSGPHSFPQNSDVFPRGSFPQLPPETQPHALLGTRAAQALRWLLVAAGAFLATQLLDGCAGGKPVELPGAPPCEGSVQVRQSMSWGWCTSLARSYVYACGQDCKGTEDGVDMATCRPVGTVASNPDPRLCTDMGGYYCCGYRADVTDPGVRVPSAPAAE